MTWPTISIDVTDTDADTDNPLLARQDIKDMMDKINLIMAHVSAFVQPVLASADAASFRSAIGALQAFPSGTRMLFQQTSAPTGWTKDVSAAFNDAALRMTTGTVGTGGADAFSTLFGAGKSTAGFTLTSAESWIHGHGTTESPHGHGTTESPHAHTQINGSGYNGGTGHTINGYVDESNGGNLTNLTSNGAVTGLSVNANSTGLTINNAGGGGAHAHVLNNFNLKFADCIIASKD
jgi:hypothetical protein